jgi:hypothetical protein
MPDITGLRQAIQDLVAPELKAIESKQDAMSRQMDVQHEALVKTLEAFRAEMRAEFARLKPEVSGSPERMSSNSTYGPAY